MQHERLRSTNDELVDTSDSMRSANNNTFFNCAVFTPVTATQSLTTKSFLHNLVNYQSSILQQEPIGEPSNVFFDLTSRCSDEILH